LGFEGPTNLFLKWASRSLIQLCLLKYRFNGTAVSNCSEHELITSESDTDTVALLFKLWFAAGPQVIDHWATTA